MLDNFYDKEINFMIYSMTAFARKQIQNNLGALTLEIRTVNHRYMDISFKLPDSCRELEPKLRTLAARYVKRGRLDIFLRFQPGPTMEDDVVINEKLSKDLSSALSKIKILFQDQTQTLNPLDILRWPGVMQTVEGDRSQLHETALQLFDEAFKELALARQSEGEKLKAVLLDRLTLIDETLAKTSPLLADILELQKTKLKERFEEANLKLDPERLEQEMVMTAQRIDVTEELDRLKMHVEEVRNILEKGGDVGRRLDFLMQELNREANTLGSKSISEITTKISVDLKVIIEQMREQIQNIE